MAAGPSLNSIIEALRRQTDLEVLRGLLKYPVDLDRDAAGALKISRDVIGKLRRAEKMATGEGVRDSRQTWTLSGS